MTNEARDVLSDLLAAARALIRDQDDRSKAAPAALPSMHRHVEALIKQLAAAVRNFEADPDYAAAIPFDPREHLIAIAEEAQAAHVRVLKRFPKLAAFEQRPEEDQLDHEVVNEVSRQLREALGSEQADLGETICRLLVGGLQHDDLTRSRAREFGERLAFVLREPFRSRAKPMPRFDPQAIEVVKLRDRKGNLYFVGARVRGIHSDRLGTVKSLEPAGPYVLFDGDDEPQIRHAQLHVELLPEEPPRLAGAAVEGLAILNGVDPKNAAQLRDQHNAGADMRPWVEPKRQREADAPESTLVGATSTMGAVEAVRTKQRIDERARRLAAPMLERWRDNTPGEQTVDGLESRTYDALMALVHSIARELEP